MQPVLDHERLSVYQESLRLVSWSGELLDKVPKGLAVHGQLDRASTSIPLNIAEGNGKFTAPDRCKSFDTARGSALECAACLDVLAVRKKIDQGEADEGKAMLAHIVSMLVGLIKATSSSRVYEDAGEYGRPSQLEQERG